MLDIRFIKENANLVKENMKRKFQEKSDEDDLYIKELSNKIKKFEKAVSELKFDFRSIF